LWRYKLNEVCDSVPKGRTRVEVEELQQEKVWIVKLNCRQNCSEATADLGV